MIDLSYLTEEEQEMIVTVLKRDAELKKAEEDRVKQLQKIPADGGKLKYLSGEWFYEAKSQRHLDRIHGSDIIRASMNQKDQMTLLSLTQSWAARTRALSNGNKEKLRPPERLGENQEPPKQPKEDRESDHASRDLKQERPRVALRSSTKRHNPFNRASLVLSETPGETASQLTSGAAELHETTAGESFSPLKSDVSGPTDDLSLKGAGRRLELPGDQPSLPADVAPEGKPTEKGAEDKNLDGTLYGEQAGFVPRDAAGGQTCGRVGSMGTKTWSVWTTPRHWMRKEGRWSQAPTARRMMAAVVSALPRAAQSVISHQREGVVPRMLPEL
ncbi:hypothetical protein ANANG_G00233030 [Anguilla anguilla]|uniref:RabBD domain-containing protein n=1 Tax=Anguilla anguilla TaxID=7936 RepID=A0A9D3RRB1_ANGAN|nr:hypothetical protein ANANG_G00233030 [Anguilla anguilla]